MANRIRGKLGDAGKGGRARRSRDDHRDDRSLWYFDPLSSTYIQALESWLARNAADYERDGQVRAMGYNSPFVWKSQRFYEIEIPVKKRCKPQDLRNRENAAAPEIVGLPATDVVQS